MADTAWAWNKEIHGTLCLEVGVWLMQSHFRIVGGGSGRREEKKCLQGAGSQCVGVLQAVLASLPPCFSFTSAPHSLPCLCRKELFLARRWQEFFSGFFFSFKRALCAGCSVLGSSPTVWGEKALWFGHNADSHCQSQLAFAGHPLLFLLNKAFFLAGKFCFSKHNHFLFLKTYLGRSSISFIEQFGAAGWKLLVCERRVGVTWEDVVDA